ncbi:MAG: UDP-N-acetylmuramoyl-L-alanine--D-glutamate ligase [Candidatus Falkowbacteria bacterium]|nr:UDP-N-acetylmuramoyl-L-alanine--D-glutamate ligase [Candidatus Falkowbacteria bacterium]
MKKNIKKSGLDRLETKKIALLGFGLDNQALLALLEKHKIAAEITICDFHLLTALPAVKSAYSKINYQLGSSFNKRLDKFNILFRSPGWPLACPGIRAALKNGRTELSNPLNLFFSLCPSKNIIGVSGTKGKGTTASLIYKILADAKKRVWLGGNIGVSPLGFLDKIKATDYVVLELSSFQLEDLKYSPRFAVITNLFKEHLAPADPNNPNSHSSYKAYWLAKLQIAKNKDNKYLVVNKNLAKKIKASGLKTKIIYFGASSLPSLMIGDFNRQNIAAAVASAELLKIKPSVYKKTVANFTNLEHRLELVKKIKGVRYFDNSFSTTPESTALDLKSFSTPIILIAGGADKGADFRPLAKIIKQRVKLLILLPDQATPRLQKAVMAAGFQKNCLKTAADMKTAVRIAKIAGAESDVVLLSTGCASFGIFKNYKERGDLFKKYVRSRK